MKPDPDSKIQAQVDARRPRPLAALASPSLIIPAALMGVGLLAQAGACYLFARHAHSATRDWR